jgi:hypothetical protein
MPNTSIPLPHVTLLRHIAKTVVFDMDSLQKEDSLVILVNKLSQLGLIRQINLLGYAYVQITELGVHELFVLDTLGQLNSTNDIGTEGLTRIQHNLKYPLLTSMSPISAREGETVHLYGVNLSEVQMVLIGGKLTYFTIESPTHISFELAPGYETGRVSVAVPGTGVAATTDSLTVLAPASYAVSGVQYEALSNNALDKYVAKVVFSPPVPAPYLGYQDFSGSGKAPAPIQVGMTYEQLQLAGWMPTLINEEDYRITRTF